MLLDLLSSDSYLVFHIKINHDSCDLLFDALFISLDQKHDSRYNSQVKSKDWWQCQWVYALKLDYTILLFKS